MSTHAEPQEEWGQHLPPTSNYLGTAMFGLWVKRRATQRGHIVDNYSKPVWDNDEVW